MNIKFKSITMKNFLSIGNVTQTVRLDDDGISLIMGDNQDIGIPGARNGAGKSTLVQAICFALYGVSLTNIKRDNLVNKTNLKNMIVSLEFTTGTKNYRIERGRKPAILKFFIDDELLTDPEANVAQGENKFTQQEIDRVIGISHTLFKQIIALHSKTKPFLSLSDKEQREIIEELLGITQLSQKADELKKKIKETKDLIKEQEIRIKTILESNSKIESHIKDMKFKMNIWDKEHDKKVEKLQNEYDQLSKVDIENEINNHKKYQEWNSINQELTYCLSEITSLEKQKSVLEKNKKNVESRLSDTIEHKCPECSQKIHSEKMNEIKKSIEDQLEKIILELETIDTQLLDKVVVLQDTSNKLDNLGGKPNMLYRSLDEAYNHQRLLDSIDQTLTNEKKTINPYIDQIAGLNAAGIQDISYNELNDLTSLKEHQEFLFKLLTNKDSFIRQRIIDQNINFLNSRLNYYLDIMNLPHEVKFNSDLSVDIINLGKEYDFDQLSSGEQNRLVLSLSWAFRDIWETLNNSYNFIIIDELIDSGMDVQGMDSSLEILRKFSLERNKNIYLISHKGEIENKADRIMMAQKEGGFTSYIMND